MSSNPSNLGKSLSPSTSFPAAQQSTAFLSSFDSAQRARSVQPGLSLGTPRNNQGSRKQHRNQRRPGRLEIDLDDSMADYRATSGSNRRNRTSITHLLNYSSPRPFQEYNRNYRRNPTWGPGSGYHAADKAKYVHFCFPCSSMIAKHTIIAHPYVRHLYLACILHCSTFNN